MARKANEQNRNEDVRRVTWLNLGLRVGLEVGVVAAFAFWGYRVVDGGWRPLLAVAAPLAGFGFWGLIDFRQAGRWAELLRLVEELVISGLAALALLSIGAHTAAAMLLGLSLGYHGSVYFAGERLLRAP